MENERPLRVRIMQDSLGPAIDLQIFEYGVDIFKEVVPYTEIVGVGQRASVPEGEETYIRADLHKPVGFRADLGIIATRRTLLLEEALPKGRLKFRRRTEEYVLAGVAIRGASLRVPRLAFVHVGDDPVDVRIAHTVVHEFAHLLNVKREGDTYDGTSHCTDESCLSHNFISEDVGSQYQLCTECTDQVATNAQIFADYKARKPISTAQRQQLLH